MWTKVIFFHVCVRTDQNPHFDQCLFSSSFGMSWFRWLLCGVRVCICVSVVVVFGTRMPRDMPLFWA